MGKSPRWDECSAYKEYLASMPISAETKARVRARYKGHCGYCGAETTKLTIDHIVSRANGGTNEEWNLMPSCRECNLRKGSMGLKLFRTKMFGPWGPKRDRRFYYEKNRPNGPN